MSDISKGFESRLKIPIDQDIVGARTNTKCNKLDPIRVKTHLSHYSFEERPLHSIAGLIHVKLEGHIAVIALGLRVHRVNDFISNQDIVHYKPTWHKGTLVWEMISGKMSLSLLTITLATIL